MLSILVEICLHVLSNSPWNGPSQWPSNVKVCLHVQTPFPSLSDCPSSLSLCQWLTGRMGSIPILPIRVPITISTMINFDGQSNGDGNGVRMGSLRMGSGPFCPSKAPNHLRDVRACLYVIAESTLLWHSSHWNQWKQSCSRMGLQPILEQLHCGQWELCRKHCKVLFWRWRLVYRGL